jgi:hypothetical protein
VTIGRSAPHGERETARLLPLICPTAQAENICEAIWTVLMGMKWLAKFVCARTRFSLISGLRRERRLRNENGRRTE